MDKKSVTASKKPDGRGKNPRSQMNIKGRNQYEQDTGLEKQSIHFVLELSRFGKVDLSDPESIEDAYEKYLELCDKYDTKPLISGLCRVLGTDRQALIEWSNGKRTELGERLSPDSALTLKNILQNQEVFWEFAFQGNGYRNPVTGIFLAKNNFGYKDTSETIVSHKVADTGPTKAQLEAKYMAALPEEQPAKDVKVEPVEPDAVETPKRKRGRPRKKKQQ